MTAGDAIAAMERFPYAELETLLRGQRPLVLAPHPDDESLGCGGLIAECCCRGIQPVVAILTDGAASHPGSKQYPPLHLASLRVEEARSAASKLGLDFANLVFFNYPDSALPSGPDIVAKIVDLVKSRGCGVILSPWFHDPHCDHEAAAIIAENVAHLAKARFLSYPVWGRLLPPAQDLQLPKVHGWRLAISEHLEAKQEAIASHRSQYSDLINDSPNGFRLPRNLLEVFKQPYEIFIDSSCL